MSHHFLTDARDAVSVEKALVFVMEGLKDGDGKKKKKKPAVTAANFGAGLDIDKYKANERFVTGFRCRLGSEFISIEAMATASVCKI